MGLLAPVEIAEYLGLRPTWADGTSVGGATWEFMARARRRRHPGRPRRGRRARVRLDDARRPQAGPPPRQPQLRHPGPGPVRRPVRPHAHRQVRDGRPPAHVRVRHDDRAARRDRGVGPLQRRLQPRRLLPRPDHDRRRAVGADDRRPVHDAALLHPVRRRRRRRAHDRGAGPRLRQGAGVGARHGRGHVAHDDERVGRTSPSRRPSAPGALAFERAGLTPDDVDICQIYDAFTVDGAADARGARLLRQGRGRGVRGGRPAALGRCPADEHRRRRPFVLPPGHARACSCSSRR